MINYIIYGIFGLSSVIIIARYLKFVDLKEKYYLPINNLKNTNNNDISKFCIKLANNIIQNNYISNKGLIAGSTHYKDLWTRDFFISSLGIITNELKDYKIIKNTLKILEMNQRDDGLIPLRYGEDNYYILFATGKRSGNNKPVYIDDKNCKEPTDSNPQFIILLYYIMKYDDQKFVKEMLPSLIKSYYYMDNNLKDGLLYGEYFDTWHDTFQINGASLFSNVLYLHSLKCLFLILRNYKYDKINLDKLKKKYNNTYKIFLNSFWNGEYLKIYPNINSMEVAGNALAILFNIIEKDKVIKIINYKYKNLSKYDFGLKVTIPEMNEKYIPWYLYLVGLESYHKSKIWVWPNLLMLTAELNITSNEILEEQILKYEKNFYRYGKIYEIYENDGKPFTNMIQSSEINFTESCGTYLFFKNTKKNGNIL